MITASFRLYAHVGKDYFAINKRTAEMHHPPRISPNSKSADNSDKLAGNWLNADILQQGCRSKKTKSVNRKTHDSRYAMIVSAIVLGGTHFFHLYQQMPV